MSARKPMRRNIRGGRPYFFSHAAIDKVLNMVVVLGGEVWMLRERLAALEAIQTNRGALKPGEVDAYEFTAEQEATLAEQRKEFIESLFRILEEQVQAARAVKKPDQKKPAQKKPPQKKPAQRKPVNKKGKAR